MPAALVKVLTIAVAAGCFVGAFFTRSDQSISTALVGAGMLALGLAGPELGAKK